MLEWQMRDCHITNHVLVTAVNVFQKGQFPDINNNTHLSLTNSQVGMKDLFWIY